MYKQRNDGLEVLTRLDAPDVEFGGERYPLWCFLGDDLDEFQEAEASVNAGVMFSSFSHDCYCDVQDIRYVFDKDRSD